MDLNAHAVVAAIGHLHGRTRQPGGAHILDADNRARAHQLQTRLDEQLLSEGVSHLHGRPLFFTPLVELLARHRGAMDAISPRARAHVKDRVPDPRRHATKDPILLCDADGEHVDQDVSIVRGVEVDLSANGGDAHAVAIPSDPRDDAMVKVWRSLVVDGAKAQAVEVPHGARAHGEDIAQDASDTRRSALIRFDIRGVVVRLHLEHGREAIADIHRARVLARPLDHLRSGRGQPPEVHARALVGAVLAPHRAHHANLWRGRRATELVQDELVFFLCEPVPESQFLDVHC